MEIDLGFWPQCPVKSSKMGISQEEIVTHAQTVTKGLEALRLEHQSLLGGLKNATSPAGSTNSASGGDKGDDQNRSEKALLLEKSLEMIDLGLGEAHVMSALASHLQVNIESQSRRY